MSNVITSKLFTGRMDADALRELQSSGVRVLDAANVEELDLPPLQYGEEVVGTVNEEEARLLASAHALADKAAKMERAIAADGVQRYANLMQELAKQIKEGNDEPLLDAEPINPEDAVMYALYETKLQDDLLTKMFFVTVSTRLKLFDYRLGVRQGGKIVKLQRRW